MRRLQHLVADIWEGIRTRPGRAAAAWGAVLAAVALLTLLTAVLGGLEQRAGRLVDELGANTLAILASAPVADGTPTALSQQHVSILAASLPDCHVAAARRYACRAGRDDDRFPVFGISGAFAHVRGWELSSGRFLDSADERRGDRHALAGKALADRFAWRVGDFIMLDDSLFRLVGILATHSDSGAGAGTGALPNDSSVFVKSSVAVAALERTPGTDASVDVIFIQGSPGQTVEKTAAAARRVLGMPGLLGGRVTWMTPDRLVRDLRKLQTTIGLAAGGVVGLCLALAGTTLASLMLLTIRERIPEIGLRRAIGARPADIAGLFLLEALLIAGTAAATAAGVSGLILRIAEAQIPLPLRRDPAVFCLPVCVALVLGVVCAWAPALRAARLRPADALRTE